VHNAVWFGLAGMLVLGVGWIGNTWAASVRLRHLLRS
jgi:hypothetical protein